MVNAYKDFLQGFFTKIFDNFFYKDFLQYFLIKNYDKIFLQ